MSRGGRGGGGRGGFGGGPGRGGPFGNDDLKPDYSVTELFPPQPPPVQSALSKEERAMVARWRGQREKIHNGPMYTVMGRKRGMEDPFNDIARYSQKYRKLERRAPKLDARPYIAEFFPEELWATMGIATTADGAEEKKKKKTLLISALDEFELQMDEAAEEEEGEGGGGGGKKEEGDKDDDENEEEEEDDHFSEDEDDDYNAERYFESGDDMEDYGDDDGGDGGDYF